MSCSKASDGCAIRCYQLSYFSLVKIVIVPQNPISARYY